MLNSEPTSSVTVHFDSNDTTEGTVTVMSLTFTTGNWSTPQSVTVTGVDDSIEDGNQAYWVGFTATTSSDPKYNGNTPTRVDITNNDDTDLAGFDVTAISGDTSESGGTATFDIKLKSQPTANVTLTLSSSKPGEGTPNQGSVMFTPVNWNTPVTITVTGQDDRIDDGDQAYAIDFQGATSTDLKYAGTKPSSIAVNNLDDGFVGSIVVGVISGVSTTEAGNGDPQTFTVRLSAEPSAAVTVNFDSDNEDEGTVDVTSLTFTPLNWSQDQTVTVTGADDGVMDGDVQYSIVFTATSSTDLGYSGQTPADIDLTNIDND